MAFGHRMRFDVNGRTVELAPLSREVMHLFISAGGGGMQDMEVTKYLMRPSAPTLEDEYDWYEKTRQSHTSIVWGIYLIDKGERTLIGNTSLNGIGGVEGNTLFRQAESGSMIFRREYWGQGIASAAHKARAWYAFSTMGLHRITSGVLQGNIGSSKALGRSGYVHTHSQRNALYADGEMRTLDFFECLNPLDLLWDQWWHGDDIPPESIEARQVTLETLEWGDQHINQPSA